MKRKLFPIVFAWILLLSLSGIVHANPVRPMNNIDCVASCTADSVWKSISTHGAASSFTIDDPGVGSSGSYYKSIEESNSSGWEIVGEMKNGYCGSGLYFWHNYDTATNAVCDGQVPSGDINNQVTFKLSYYVSHGGGGFAYILDGHNNCNPCGFSDSHLTNAFTNNDYNATTTVSSFTGHFVWGGEWTFNQFFDGTNWKYQTSASSVVVGNPNGDYFPNPVTCGGNPGSSPPPPQMCWNSKPNGSANNGGTLYSCVYDSHTNSCTLGS